MKNKHLLFCSAILLAAMPFLPSCSEQVAEEKPKYDYKRDDSLPQEYLSELGNFRIGMEQIAGLNKTIMLEKISYNSQLLHPSSKVSACNNSKMQAITLGVYASDLNYAATYKQAQDMRNYMEAVLQMAQKLGVQSAFDKEILEKLTLPDNPDKMRLFSQAFRHLSDNMHSQERSRYVALMIAGGWVESLYLAASLLKSKPLNPAIHNSFFDNAYTYDNVKNILKVFEKDCKDCKEVLIELETISAPLKNLIVNARYGITQEQIDQLHTPLTALRNKLVS